MKNFARVENNTVVQVLDVSQESFQLVTAMRVRAGNSVILVSIDDVIPTPQVNWIYNPETQIFTSP